MAKTLKVADIALTRSGDKGADANVGVWARTDAAYQLLEAQLTEKVVKTHFRELCKGSVSRYALPNLRAFNFILHDSLGGGGSATLRSDAQGKVYGLGMSLIAINVSDDFEA